VAVSELALRCWAARATPRWCRWARPFRPHLFPFDTLARCGARAMRRLKPLQITSALSAGDEELRDLLRRYTLQGVPWPPTSW
jgi:DNA-binding transcriptional MocR family regulator